MIAAGLAAWAISLRSSSGVGVSAPSFAVMIQALAVMACRADGVPTRLSPSN